MKLQLLTILMTVLGSAFAFAKPVILNIVVADEIAIQSETSQIIERMFADRMPGAEFRRVVVQAQSPMIPHLFSDEARVHAELKEKMASVLKPGDELTYLIIDTHGGTDKPEDAANPRDAGSTILYHLGNISYDQGVDAQFADLFDSVKPYAAKDLTIIMNACSVFCGGEDQASLRAEAMLAYFGAPNGTVYGSTLPEIDTFAFTKYGKWRDFLPTKKVVWVMNSLSLVLASTLAAAVVQEHDGNPYAYFAGTFAVMQIATYFRPLLSKFSEIMRWVNQGYLFQFHKGRLFKAEFMQKMKDVVRSFALTGKKPAVTGAALGLRCQAVHL